jgi:hypothetical protein
MIELTSCLSQCPSTQIPDPGQHIYSVNEGNQALWAPEMRGVCCLTTVLGFFVVVASFAFRRAYCSP